MGNSLAAWGAGFALCGADDGYGDDYAEDDYDGDSDGHEGGLTRIYVGRAGGWC